MLQRTSYVRPGKVFTAHESLIGTVVGTLRPETLEAIRQAVISVIREL
jgi:mRNA interferase MazF